MHGIVYDAIHDEIVVPQAFRKRFSLSEEEPTEKRHRSESSRDRSPN